MATVHEIFTLGSLGSIASRVSRSSGITRWSSLTIGTTGATLARSAFRSLKSSICLTLHFLQRHTHRTSRRSRLTLGAGRSERARNALAIFVERDRRVVSWSFKDKQKYTFSCLMNFILTRQTRGSRFTTFTWQTIGTGVTRGTFSLNSRREISRPKYGNKCINTSCRHFFLTGIPFVAYRNVFFNGSFGWTDHSSDCSGGEFQFPVVFVFHMEIFRLQCINDRPFES
uniref:Uncharacterized protein n=1 Tax=Romanomermis culicivorax TaxID=13658 RepID=A0A915IHB3_ROMCU